MLTFIGDEAVRARALPGAAQDVPQRTVEQPRLLQPLLPPEGCALILRHGEQRLQRGRKLQHAGPGLRGDGVGRAAPLRAWCCAQCLSLEVPCAARSPGQPELARGSRQGRAGGP